MRTRALVFCLLLMLPAPAFAVSPDEMLADTALEARAREISSGLRCLVCQNQSIDDSEADLARDLRLLVRERLVAGDSNAEAEQYIVDRYGEYVLLNPRLNVHTVLLWVAAPLLLLSGLAAILLARHRIPRLTEGGLTEEEVSALSELERDPDRQ